jgi:ferredoxin-NADP reductase
VYIGGSSSFADAATDAVTTIGVPVERIRVERFGPTGLNPRKKGTRP